MTTFYSNGKLLITGEYVVLDGAKALALPTKFGQTLTVKTNNDSKIIWKSLDENNTVWFEGVFEFVYKKIIQTEQNDNEVSERLVQILNAAKKLNPKFLKENEGYSITSKLDFPKNWGLGSSSTLLNNIAQWANVDAFELSNATFGGSGYDIACAQNNSPIIYSIENGFPKIEITSFKKSFESQLFFVHLNQKQNSREAIKTYQNNKHNLAETLLKINTITNQFLEDSSLKAFENLIEKHEDLIGKITKQTPIKKRLFSDYNNAIKSLGAWGGDFVLATGTKDYVENYFRNKGYHIIISYQEMILD